MQDNGIKLEMELQRARKELVEHVEQARLLVIMSSKHRVFFQIIYC